MPPSTRAEVEAALKAYRASIAAYNRPRLEVYVTFLNNASIDEDEEPDDDAKEVRLKCLAGLLEAEEEDYELLGISEPNDVLERYDELATRFVLDGTFVIEDKEERAAEQQDYFSYIERALKEKSLEEVRETIAIPEDFRILAENVDGLVGSGLAPDRGLPSQPVFWRGYDEISRRVQKPEEFLELRDDWEVAGGWETGWTQDTNSFIVYCRKPGEDWDWRYIFLNDYGMGGTWVFENIADLLAWYALYRDEEDMPRLSDFSENSIRNMIVYGDY